MSKTYSVIIKDLSFKYPSSKKELLNIPELNIVNGQHLFIEGTSGKGKTTFLNIIAGVQKGYNGSVNVLGQQIDLLNDKSLDQFRADQMGIVFQLFNLIPYLSVLENILLPFTFSNNKKNQVLKKNKDLETEAINLCEKLGLNDIDIKKHKAVNLSVGQQQRVAAARALIGAPKIILADEPTSALDEQNTQQFMELLLSECDRNSSTLLFVSHDKSLKSYFKQSYSLNNLSN